MFEGFLRSISSPVRPTAPPAAFSRKALTQRENTQEGFQLNTSKKKRKRRDGVNPIPFHEKPSLLSILTKVRFTPGGSSSTDRISNINFWARKKWLKLETVRSESGLLHMWQWTDTFLLFDFCQCAENTMRKHVHSCSLNMKSPEPLVLILTLSHQSVPCRVHSRTHAAAFAGAHFEALKSAWFITFRPEMPAIACALITTMPLSALNFNYDSPLTGVRLWFYWVVPGLVAKTMYFRIEVFSSVSKV